MFGCNCRPDAIADLLIFFEGGTVGSSHHLNGVTGGLWFYDRVTGRRGGVVRVRSLSDCVRRVTVCNSSPSSPRKTCLCSSKTV